MCTVFMLSGQHVDSPLVLSKILFDFACSTVWISNWPSIQRDVDECLICGIKQFVCNVFIYLCGSRLYFLNGFVISRNFIYNQGLGPCLFHSRNYCVLGS